MPLEVHRITDPSDLEAFVDIQLAAFQGGGGMTAFLSPHPPPADYRKKIIDRQIQSLKDEPDVVYLKVIDTELDGKMIACAKWRITTKERTEEEVNKMCPGPDEKDKENQALVDFWAFLSRVRRQYMGKKPFYFLHLLVTHPDHQRRGAGALLVGWGTERADKAQLPSFLESSLAGRRLYTKMGFQTVEVVVFDLAKYGSEGTDESHVMIRPKPE